MKVKHLIALASLMAVIALALPGPALAGDGIAKVRPDEFVFGENYVLEEGETVDGNLWVFGGNVTLQEGSTVEGDVLVFGGNLIADGTVDGSVNMLGGSVTLGATAVVEGDVTVTGGSLTRASGARVGGEVVDNVRSPFRFNMPRGWRIPWVNAPMPWVDLHYPFWGVLSYFFRAFLVSALAVLVVMFLPRQTAQVGRAVVAQPLISGGLGLITAVVAPFVLLGLAITILLIPVSFLGVLLLALMVAYGWIGLGLEVGQRMAQSLFKTEWTLPVAAGLGTLVLTLVVDGIGQIPCVGWTAPALVGMVGLGAVLLTRFGVQAYPSPVAPAATHPLPTAPAAPAVEPARPGEEPPTLSGSGAAGAPAQPEPTPGEEKGE